MPFVVRYSARSDVGRRRSNNEDNLYCNEQAMTVSSRVRPFFVEGVCEVPSVFAVFDGMGGEDCGELASLTAAETLREHLVKGNNVSSDDVNAFAVDANTKLMDIMRAQHISTGTTLALVAAGDDSFTAYNLGDSRVYRLEGGRLIRVTQDHTMAQEKVRMGLITPAQAERDRDRNVLTRCLGLSDEAFDVYPDSYGPFMFEDNVRALICSDGLTDMVSDDEIAAILSRPSGAGDIVNELVDAALSHGGRDNITCIVLEFEKGA